MSPVALAAPAMAGAAESSGCPNGFGATAAANTLAIGGMDLRGIGFKTPPLPELRAATAHAGFAGGPARAASGAWYVQSSGVLPPGLIGPGAYRQAPPPHEQAATVPAPASACSPRARAPAIVLGAGLLLVVAGRMFLILSRRRSAA